MATGDWEDVKRLAADFKRAQLGTGAHRLSERNCIEIVNTLIEHKLIEVTYTSDGKEYITPEQIKKEILDELFDHGGRLNLVDLCQILKLDYRLIEASTNELVKLDRSLFLIVGQFFNKEYLDKLAEQINLSLQQKGQVNINALIKQYDIPGYFLQKQIEIRLGSIIKGKADPSDPRVIFNGRFLDQKKMWLTGVMTAITKPTSLSTIGSRSEIPEKIFFNILDELISSNRISGTISGGRQLNQAAFIPRIYSKAQNDWVRTFWSQNGYLEYDNMTRLGITDPVGFIKRTFYGEDSSLTFIKTCCVGKSICERIMGVVKEALVTGSWIDILTILPSVFSPDDAFQLLEKTLKDYTAAHKEIAEPIIFCNSVVVSQDLLHKLVKSFQTEMEIKAKKDIDSGDYLTAKLRLTVLNMKAELGEAESKKEKKDERRKKAVGGKGGGGIQGRETKTKSTRKKAYGRKVENSDSEGESSKTAKANKISLEFATKKEIEKKLAKIDILADASDEFLTAVSERFYMSLNEHYMRVLDAVFQATSAKPSDSRRKTFIDMQDKITGAIMNLRLYEKGIKQFPNKDLQLSLTKHLLKTSGYQLVNYILLYAVDTSVLKNKDSDDLTAQDRMMLIQDLAENTKEPVTKLNKAASGESIEHFHECLNVVLSSEVLNIVVKKIDKKKEKQVALTIRQGLIDHLSVTLDVPATLHIAALILFHSFTQCILSASGKFVPSILNFLQQHLPKEPYEVLHDYQGLVIKQMTLDEDDDEMRQIKITLEELTPKVKEIAVTTKKNVHSSTEAE